MRKVILNMSENYKYKTIKSCYLKHLSKQGAATRLDISIRQVNRLIKKYECEAKTAFIHGNNQNVKLLTRLELKLSVYIIQNMKIVIASTLPNYLKIMKG